MLERERPTDLDPLLEARVVSASKRFREPRQGVVARQRPRLLDLGRGGTPESPRARVLAASQRDAGEDDEAPARDSAVAVLPGLRQRGSRLGRGNIEPFQVERDLGEVGARPCLPEREAALGGDVGRFGEEGKCAFEIAVAVGQYGERAEALCLERGDVEPFGEQACAVDKGPRLVPLPTRTGVDSKPAE